MDISDKTKQMVESKAYLLEIEKRLVSLESSMQNLSAGMQRGSLIPEQEQRVVAVEERLENVEDLQMVANLDLIRMREILEKLQGGAVAQPAVSGTEFSSQRKVGEIETIIAGLNRRVDAIASSNSYNKSATETGAKEEIKNIKKELDSFKKETEESVKIIVNSVKKLAGRIK